MKKLLLVLAVVAGSLQAGVKHTNTKVTVVLPKTSVDIRKDIGIAD